MILLSKRIAMLLAVLLAFVLALVFAGPVAAADAAQENTPDSEYCLGCHSQPGQVMLLPSGEQQYISIDPEAFEQSIHSQVNISCNACHPDIQEYPHPENASNNRREYVLQYQDTCTACHGEKVQPDGMHQQQLAAGNQNAPICADCHNPHDQPRVTDESGEVTFIEKAKIAQTCARCHSQIYDEYSTSVHGAAAIGENNPDVPVCTTCHGVHMIEDPRTTEFRLSSPRMCGDCHTDGSIMDKYGLSTEVYNTYVSDFHGTTVTLFEKETPDQETNKAVCYDCHGVHNILSVSDPKKGLQVKQNMLQACQRCHPDANENFPDSWLSHYIPTAEKTPLVYYVNLFYKFFIPGVLIPMGIFILSDIYRKIFRQNAHTADVKKEQ
jgi:cytochrome c1